MNFDFQPVLEGKFITLRPLKEEDRVALFAVASDPLIWEQHPEKDRYQYDVFNAFFNEAMRSKGAFLALDAKSGSVIGSSRYYDWNAAEKSVVIGYTFLSRICWGQNYNKEMKNLMLNHAFRFVDTVLFHIGENNIRSRKAIEKIGAQLSGKIERQHLDGRSNPSVIYQIKQAWL
jgi:RimJ/RimL family protein N-acetyltransferase